MDNTQNQTNLNQTELIKGIAASGGIAIGKVFLIEEESESGVVLPRRIPKQQLKKEVERFSSAVSTVKQELTSTKEKMLKILGKEHAPLADAYLIMLEDPILTKDVVKRITEQSVNAEYALWSTMGRILQSFELIDDEYFRERKNDVQELGKRILRHLTGIHRRALTEITDESVVIAHSLDPTDIVAIKERGGNGFAINIGGKTSHVLLIAEGLELPAVVGLKNITTLVKHGDSIIIDGNQGLAIINPDEQTIENYRREYEIQLRERHELERLKDFPAETKDGHRVVLACNVDTPEELKSVLAIGAEGIGLLRTEFLYLNRTTLPTEDEQYEVYKDIARKVLPYTVIIRTLDLGGDKIAPLGLEGLAKENNPYLGLRAIRLCLKYPELFKMQLRAILRASNEGRIKIMFPMISGVEEFRQAKLLFEQAKTELSSRGESFDENIEVGAMIEVPSAALTADLIAKEADFLSVGTNDLIQYTLAVDRMNEAVAEMYEPLHLSILRLLKHIIDAGHNAGKWVGMCGEMASDTTFTTTLLGMGLNEFSVPPVAVPKIKKIIRSTTFVESKDLARDILNTTDRQIVIKTLRKMQMA
ncbi:MAG: phosphoenolpyruvate--protein phosphotransferase [Elusimicrobiota bacterium]|nr:phosphoenolpyruvate--protein phosphotransferase [Elusimicrobiota bacterium]